MKSIIEYIDPMPIWNFDDWCFLLEDQEILTEEYPYYNEYALYVTMCYMVSEYGQMIAKRLGVLFSEIPPTVLLEMTNKMAVERLRKAKNDKTHS